MVAAFKKIQSNERTQNMLQDNVAESLKILNQPFFKGHLIENITMIPGDNSINTGLDGKLNGWSVQRLIATTGTVFWEVPNPNEKILILHCLSIDPSTISLWVF